MKRILRLLAVIVILFLIAAAWFWWNQPVPVDMSANVPADSLVYLEADSLPDIASALTETDGWKQIALFTGIPPMTQQNSLLSYWIRTTGIGPTASVIAARAQIALVLLDLNSTSNGDTLEFKPLAALVVETHTSEARVKPAVETMLDQFATRIYVTPKRESLKNSDGEFVRWVAPDGQRRIVAAFDESVVIVGNDDKAVSACLNARRGQRATLLHQPELEEMRARLHAAEALAFGYVSSANTARLASQVAPMLLGRLSNSPELQKILSAGSAKLLGNLGWSTRSFKGGIEDNYFVSMQSNLAARLRPTFASMDQGLQGAWEFLPVDTNSVTTYNLNDPVGAWQAVNAAVSSQLDVVSAIVFTTGSRALLAPYGIDDPDSFLKTIKPELLTVRLDAQSAQAVVIARVANAQGLHQFVSRRFGARPRVERAGDNEIVVSPDERYAASFAGDYFLLGAPEDVRRCLGARASHATLVASPRRLADFTHFLERPGTSNIVTYAKDSERVRAMITALRNVRGSRAPASSADEVDRMIEDLPYATTETTCDENGFERRTRSPFGQFSSLFTLLAPAPSPVAPK